MKTSSVLLALSMAMAVSAAPQNSHHELRQFNGFGGNNGGFGGNNGGFGGNIFGNNNGGRNNNGGQNNNNGGKNNNGGQNNNTKGGTGNQGNNQNAGGAAGGNNGTATAGNSNNNGTVAAGNNSNNGTAAAGNNSTSTGGNNSQDAQQSLTLDPGVIAKGFANNGQDVPAAGQVASLTSTNNFINFCLTVPNLPITNGQQITGGSCNPAPMGVLPSTDNMPSSKFVSPKNGDVLKENTAFTITMAIQGMQTGFFVNADENYFAAPQFLNQQGQIQGHSHVVVELLSAIDQTTPTDPKKFAFFKGLNAAAANGQLTADVTNGLPAGAYKLSSINSAANHQPVLVPIAQHGSLDDAVYFTVTADGQANAGSGVLNGSNSTAAGNNSTATGTGNAGAANAGAANAGAANNGTTAATGNTGNAGTGNGNTGKNTNTGTGKAGNQNQNTNNGKNGQTQNQNQNNQNNGGRGFGGFGGFGGKNRRFARSRL